MRAGVGSLPGEKTPPGRSFHSRPPSPQGGGIRSKAPPALLFAARARRRLICSPKTRGAERRSAPYRESRVLANTARPCARAHAFRRSTAAFLSSGPRFRDWTAASRPPDPGSFRRPSSNPVQPCKGRPHVVGADGYPRPPGAVLARHSRRRRILSRCHERLMKRPRRTRYRNIITHRKGCQAPIAVVPAERLRGPGPLRPALSRTLGIWVPAFAGTTGCAGMTSRWAAARPAHFC
jgi:hypothetical protein